VSPQSEVLSIDRRLRGLYAHRASRTDDVAHVFLNNKGRPCWNCSAHLQRGPTSTLTPLIAAQREAGAVRAFWPHPGRSAAALSASARIPPARTFGRPGTSSWEEGGVRGGRDFVAFVSLDNAIHAIEFEGAERTARFARFRVGKARLGRRAQP